MADEVILDTARLSEATGGDKQLISELASLYSSTARRYVDDMVLCLENGSDWTHAAHALKGASANIGAMRIRKLAERAEHGELDRTAIAEMNDVLNATDAELEAFADGMQPA